MYGMVVGDFGINIMPRVMTKMMRPILQHLCDFPHWLRLVSNLDDCMRMGQPVGSLLEGDVVVRHVLNVAVWYRNSDKSEWSPVRERAFLGNSVDALSMQVSAPVEKLRGFRAGIRKSLALSDRGKLTVRLFISVRRPNIVL